MIKFFFTDIIHFDAPADGGFLFQTPSTDVMDNIIDLHHDIFSIMLIIAAVVFYIIIQIILKFRSGNSDTLRNFLFTHHTSLEATWTTVPMIILTLILVPSFVLLYSMDEVHDYHVTLKVTGHQWYWNYEFSVNDLLGFGDTTISFDAYMVPDSDLFFGGFRLLETDRHLSLPVELHTRVLITSSDVLHSWAVPSFGVKMDACPGRLNQLGLFLYRAGIFYGQCSEICGINHGFMPIVVEGVPINSFIGCLRFFFFQ